MGYSIISGYDIAAQLPSGGSRELASGEDAGAYAPKLRGGSPLARGPHGSLRMTHGSGEMHRMDAPLPQLPAIAPGALQVYPVQVQFAFRPDRLFLTDSVGPASVAAVTDINIAQKSQFVSPGPVPLLRYGATFFDGHIRCETAYPGIFITVSILNLNGVADTVLGSFMGECARV